MKRILIGICALVIALGLGACSRLDPEDTALEPTLTFANLAENDAIPAEYGDLVSVTTDELYPGWAQLWFQKDDGTVVTVFVKYVNGALRQKALMIPRS